MLPVCRPMARAARSCSKLAKPLVSHPFIPLANGNAKAHTLVVTRYFEPKLPDDLNKDLNWEDKYNFYYLKKIENGPKNLDVILTQDSEDFGVEGELVTIPKHFGRRLIEENKALYASPENIALYVAKEKSSSQTLSGRRMELWLNNHGTFICPYQYNKKWTLNAENLARCFLREHNLSVPPSAFTLPDYPITNETVDANEIHEVKIKVNNCDDVTVKISIPDWTSKPS